MRKLVYLTIAVAFIAMNAMVASAAPRPEGNHGKLYDGQTTGAVIYASVDSLVYTNVTLGYTKTKRFTVSGQGLTDNVTLTLNGVEHNEILVTPDVIAPDDAAAGVIVAVRFAPVFSGELSASLILSSPGAEDVVIPIVTSSNAPNATITGDTSREFTANYGGLGSSVTEVVRWADAGIFPPVNPLMVVGNDGGDSGTLAVSAVGGGDGIDNSFYTAFITGGDGCFSARVFNGSATGKTCSVRITYLPNSLGTHHATLRLTCSNAGVPVIEVSLTGTTTLLKCDPVMRTPDDTDVSTSTLLAHWTQDCYKAGVSAFELECAPQGTDFDPDGEDYVLFDDLDPEDCADNLSAILYNRPRYCYQKMLEGLSPGGVYEYRVRAHYIDDTWSEWSNVQTASLPSMFGDINGDGQVTVGDIIMLIIAVVENDEQVLAMPNADINHDGQIDLNDIIALVDVVMSSAVVP